MALHLSRRFFSGWGPIFFAILLLLLPGAGPLSAATATAPAAPEDFGQYLSDHQADLAPFFDKNEDAVAKDASPLIISLVGKVLVLTMLLGWAVDLGLSRAFAALFAPAYGKMFRSVIYATGRFVLSLVLSVLVTLIFILAVQAAGIAGALLLLVLLLLASLLVQAVWVKYLYRTNIVISVAFYVAVLVAHAVIGLVVGPVIFGTQSSTLVAAFINQDITPKMQKEADAIGRQAAAAVAARDAIQTKLTDAKDRLTAAQKETDSLHQQIEDKKNSEDYVFSQIVKARARGDLAGAKDQFNQFLTRFPSGARLDEAKKQIADIDQALAVQAAERQQAEAVAAQQAAQFQADLLARAAKGQVTLSEMRQYLIGKSTADVKKLLGAPYEIGSDQWGYSQKMIVNPLNGEHHGLTVNFSDGAVQGVDYYYGGGG